MRIAALDDDPLQLEMLRQVALETGHSCHTYQTGSALQLELRRESFDLLIVDWHLPDMEGTDLVRWARGHVSRELPILIITHRSEEADIVEGLQAPDVAARIDPTLDALRARLPAGYRIEAGGPYEDNANAQGSIVAGTPMLLAVVALLLMVQLRSFSLSAMALLTAPLGVIGVAAALLVSGRPFGFVAMLGLIALGGMIMRNTVILVDQIRQDLDAGRTRWQAVLESTVRRFRPISLTAAAAVLAMIPLSRDVLWGPMAVAIMGGLLVATVLTVLFVPALYVALYRVDDEGSPPRAAG